MVRRQRQMCISDSYLSCAPMTRHRDHKILLGSGRYKLEGIQTFDMFPQTWHIETLAWLSRL